MSFNPPIFNPIQSSYLFQHFPIRSHEQLSLHYSADWRDQGRSGVLVGQQRAGEGGADGVEFGQDQRRGEVAIAQGTKPGSEL